VLFLPGQRLQVRTTGFWRPVSTLPLGDGRSAEITVGRRAVYKHVRVTPGDACLDVTDTSRGFRRGCRVDLVAGLVDTDVALCLLVYFLAELEQAYRA